MKKIFVSLLTMTVLFTSCDKKESLQQVDNNLAKQEVANSAKVLSIQHDAIVAELLASYDATVKLNAPSSDAVDSWENTMQQTLAVIEEVTGVKAQMIKDSDSLSQLRVSAGDDLVTYDFDQDEINLADYTQSIALEPYFDAIDVIVNDLDTDLGDKIVQINYFQEEAKSDLSLSMIDYENFINTTEVLKGSLSLWNGVASDEMSKVSSNGIMYASTNPAKWSLLKKLAFVAAADAVGAIAGTFVGSFITVSGVPVYIPAGPQGAAAGLAALSFIASKMVGW